MLRYFRFQFTIKDLLLATLWTAVSCQAWWLAWRFQPDDSAAWRYGVAGAALTCPSVALSAIFKHKGCGFLCGYFITVVVFALSQLMK